MRALPQAGRLFAIASFLSCAVTTMRADDPSNGARDFTPEQIEYFEREVRPLLVENCHKCHGAKMQKGNLRLDSRRAMLAGGDTGPAIVPGKPQESLLIDAVSYGDVYQMPPDGKLADKQIAILRRWVEAGAAWPAEVSAAETKSPVASFDLAVRAKHWAFQPLDTTPPAAVRDTAWPQSLSDVYLLSRIEAAGLTPSKTADKRTLLRRATFDLIGLPPTAGDIEAFVADERPDAFARVVDRLLASPHFGERWARHWLDLVRYAESKGHEFDYTIPNAWQYRDYCIRALNADVHYDQFVVEHIAGDLLPELSDEAPFHARRHPEQRFNESLLATGFWFLGEEVHSPVELRADELDRNDNKIDVFSKTFLGLTVACARCHDHKFDAISTKDYYSLAGYLLSASYRQAPFDALDQEQQIARQLAALRDAHQGKLIAATCAAMRPTLGRVGELLLAARDVLQASPTDETPAAASARKQAIEAVVSARHVALAELALWVEAVREAVNDPGSPLHPWAVISAARGPAIANVASLLAPQRDTEQRTTLSETASLNNVVDFANLAEGEWRQDGFTFGGGPQRRGEISFGSIERPIARVWSRAAAVSDPFWDAAALAPGVEREAGRLAWLQSGRLLRTRSFTLNGGKLYYLVSGSGYAYAAVDSHRMNNGPLHGALVREWQANERFQWIAHDLSAYRGQRVHIEFNPRQPGETKADASPILAVAQIVESSMAPSDPNSPALANMAFTTADLATAESLAAAYQRRLTQVADEVAAGELSADDALLADWLVHQLELFAPAQSESRRALSAAAQPFFDAQTALAATLPRHIHTAPAMLDGSGVDECVLLRGNPKTPGELVPRRYLEALGGTDRSTPDGGSGRLDLALQMVDPARPQVARVIVNRVWQHLFGRGLVASVDNFGVLGERPTHRELLDRLTADFMSNGWSIKRLIRRLMLSAAYPLSSRPGDAASTVDPNNLLASHQSVKRLEAEAIRDNILAASGRLNQRMFGTSTPVYLSEFMEGRGRPASGPLDGDGRRSVYLSVRRNFLSTFFLAFDYPVPFTSVGRRSVSNVPGQALTMMNSPLVAAEADRWAAQIIKESTEVTARIAAIYLTAFGRYPDTMETRQAVDFIEQQSTLSSDEARIWADLCHVILNAKELIFIE